MSVKIKRTWTCDVCGASESRSIENSHGLSQRAPDDWVTQDEHRRDGLRIYAFCPKCLEPYRKDLAEYNAKAAEALGDWHVEYKRRLDAFGIENRPRLRTYLHELISKVKKEEA